MENEYIKIDLNGQIGEVKKTDYVKAKTKDFREFGYPNLTETEVAEQLEKALAGEELNVIGVFIEGDLVNE